MKRTVRFMIPAAHIFNNFRTMGGVEAVLRHHLAKDASHGIDSRIIILMEDDSQPIERTFSLGTTSNSTIRQLRRGFAAAIAQFHPDIVIYHGTWGLPLLADLDGAARRILMLHGNTPDEKRLIESRSPWVDGVLCVNEPLRQLVLRYLPSWDVGRVGVVCYPVQPLFDPVPRSPRKGRPLVIGVSGRLIVEQKRVDRLPAFCTQLEQLGLDYRLELLGEGPERPWLERHLPTGSKVVFHGRKSGEEYWRILNAWDVIFFVSDYEGTPISMLEAMAMGAIPVFPRVGCGGDAYVAAVRPDLLYSAGDLAQAARTCQDLSAMQDAKVAELRERSRATVAGHLGESYLSGFAAFFLSVKNKPRISGNPPARPWPKNDLPLKWLAFLGALRRSFRKSRTN